MYSLLSENRWEFEILLNGIKIWKKSIILNMLRAFIVRNNNAENLLTSWKKKNWPINKRMKY